MKDTFRIRTRQLGKRYNRDWIFRGLEDEWCSGDIVGVRGANGSGKSTLLRVLSGFLRPSKGEINWLSGEDQIDKAEVYEHISLAAPYVSLIEEFKLHEFLNFHFSFKDRLESWTDDRIIDLLGFHKIRERHMSDYSSGMKQRVKLAMALLSNTPLVLLDEPTTNLDQEGKEWFQALLKKTGEGRLIFIASNEDTDFMQCTAQINMLDYKKKK